jgi:pimeloyl-ACP methyl ester carboxylesterase
MIASNDLSLTRRAVLASAGAGASAAALGGAPALAQTGKPKTFVLVHGAWHGGWCWRRVADLLEKQGHKVFTPTLTGVGERSHLMSKDINLDTHITDIVNVFKWEDLKDVCLVVHSYGGYPGSGALEQIGDRVAAIVWLDAFKPENGERLFDVTSEFSRKGLLAAMEKGEPGRPSPKAEAFAVNEKDRGLEAVPFSHDLKSNIQVSFPRRRRRSVMPTSRPQTSVGYNVCLGENDVFAGTIHGRSGGLPECIGCKRG